MIIQILHEKKSVIFEISPSGYGVHWPGLDEDLSVQGFLFPGHHFRPEILRDKK
jgi:hypothetical protein